MGCCGAANKNEAEPTVAMQSLKNGSKTNQADIKIWGDYFQSETRTICAALDFCGVHYNFDEINTLIGEHREESYLEINPVGNVPTINDGKTSILGGYSTMLAYLADSRPIVGSTLYPKAS